jgi:hypothetical protein
MRLQIPTFLVGIAITTGSALVGCSQTCGAVGCADRFHATVVSTAGDVPSGRHVVEVTADGTTTSCTFQVPPHAESSAVTVGGECPSGLAVFIGRGNTCTETEAASSSGRTCSSVNFFEDISVSGRPTQLRVRLTVDGVVMFDRTETPAYNPTEPNGPGCPPTCHQAFVHWTFVAP